jgi:hypothetical protein
VYTHNFRLSISKSNVPDGINTFFLSVDGPVEIIEPVEIPWVNERKKAFAERNPAIGVAVTEQAKGEQGTGEKKIEPVWNFDLNSCHNYLPSSNFLFCIFHFLFVLPCKAGAKRKTKIRNCFPLPNLGVKLAPTGAKCLRFCAIPAFGG